MAQNKKISAVINALPFQVQVATFLIVMKSHVHIHSCVRLGLKDFPNCHFFPILFWKFQFNNVITDHFPGSIHCVTADM